ncbi:hypothetical protein LTSEBAI_1595, partial [Salmonella enterica subsp. enterica serovar Baildon str. R6-199]
LCEAPGKSGRFVTLLTILPVLAAMVTILPLHSSTYLRA